MKHNIAEAVWNRSKAEGVDLSVLSSNEEQRVLQDTAAQRKKVKVISGYANEDWCSEEM